MRPPVPLLGRCDGLHLGEQSRNVHGHAALVGHRQQEGYVLVRWRLLFAIEGRQHAECLVLDDHGNRNHVAPPGC